MERKRVEGVVIDAVRQVQESSGQPAGPIGSDTRPLQDVDSFDSYCGVEAALFISESLGCEIPCGVFLPDDGRRHLSVSGIAEKVCGQMRMGVPAGE